MSDTDEWGGIALASPSPKTDDWGGVAIAHPQADQWGGIPVESPAAPAQPDAPKSLFEEEAEAAAQSRDDRLKSPEPEAPSFLSPESGAAISSSAPILTLADNIPGVIG